MNIQLLFCSNVASQYDHKSFDGATATKIEQTVFSEKIGGYASTNQTAEGWDQILFIEYGSFKGGSIEANEKSGYLFSGWYTIGTVTDSSQIFSIVNSNKLVTDNKRLTRDDIQSGCYHIPTSSVVPAYWAVAKYIKNPIQIQFDANGGINAPETVACYYGGSATIPLKMPTREGMTFKGWDLVKDSGALDFVAGRSYTYDDISKLTITHGDASGDLKVYASWAKNQSVIVFDPNGGKLPNGDNGFRFGEFESFLSSMPTPSYTGATFVGWFTERAGGTKVVSAQFAFDVRILYAHWTVSTWSIRFCDPTGTNADQTREFTVGVAARLPKISDDLGWVIPTGMTLSAADAWSTLPGGEGTVYANNATVQDLAQPGRMIFLYVNFKAPNVTITFNAGDGTASETTRSVAKGSRIGPLPTATHGSKSFKGWKTSAGDIIDSTFVVTSSITLVAVYESLPVFDWWDVVTY